MPPESLAGCNFAITQPSCMLNDVDKYIYIWWVLLHNCSPETNKVEATEENTQLVQYFIERKHQS